MSEQSNSKRSNLHQTNLPQPGSLFPDFSSREETEAFLKQKPELWNVFNRFPAKMQQDFYDFFTGKKGLSVTFDTVFQHIFHPVQNQERLDDNSYANVEMQKIGYTFPLARADCYAADIIMRQYNLLKNRLKRKFKFHDLQKVYCIILMEQSPREFHTLPNVYRHRRKSVFDTGIYQDDSGLHEDLFICLDSFREIVHTITKYSPFQEAWLTFLSATDTETILALLQAFPFFAEIYQEIADFMTNPEELMNMLSKEYYIMNRNEERMMVTELQEEVEAAKAKSQADVEAAKAKAKADVEVAITERDAVKSEYRALQDQNAKLLTWAKEHGYQE